MYVSGINCMPDTAYQEMMNVKRQFFKRDGIQGYHGVQSFPEGEVTPEQAHEIGKRLAEELWGDKFQVIVTTHLNTNNLHNHFILNSVSFLDGKKFCNTKKDYANMRKMSDKLCEEYDLSVLTQEEKYNKYATSSLYKTLMKDCIDYAIANAKNYDEFIKILEDLDYIVTDKNNSLSIRREPYKRNTRIERSFGDSYSKENICIRILEEQPLYQYTPVPYLLANKSYTNYNNLKEKNYYKNGSISYLIFHYEKLFGINTENALKSNITKITPELIAEIKKLDEHSNQIRFLATNKIETLEDLTNYEESTYEKINPLKSERENLWKKHKRAKSDEKRTAIENEIRDISKQIEPLAKGLKHCKNVREKVDKIQSFEIHQQVEKEKEKVEIKNDKKKKNESVSL